jgi:hypothetical protein
MDVTYKMIGADGGQYGPVTLEQLAGWIREGRVTATTQILRSDVNSWLPAAQYTELGLSQPQPPAAGAPPQISAGNAQEVLAVANLERRVKSGAGWFFFIGAFSLVNALVLMSGNAWRFLIGLGITDVIAVFSASLGSGGMIIGVLLNLAVLGMFALFGIFARKGHSWSFIAGMVCYALDGGLCALLRMQAGTIIFHGIALVFMFLGLQANLKLKARRRGAVA